MTNIISNDYFKCPTPLSEYEVMVDDFKDMLQDLEKKVSFFTIEIPHKFSVIFASSNQNSFLSQAFIRGEAQP